MKIKILLLVITTLPFVLPATAQVTIGSNIPARKGTILDLKENNGLNKEANSNKGLGLPRVALKSLKTLTVDENSKSGDYVGLIVYNTTTNQQNNELSEGTYCWFGDTWKQVVLVDDAGKTGNLLTSNGDNTYSWSNITLPDFKFWKPTQKALYNESKAKPYTFPYEKVVFNNGNYPQPDLFDTCFVYTEKMNVKSDEESEKFVLVELTANITKRTISNTAAALSFWEQYRVEILLNNNIVKKHEMIFSNPPKTIASSTLDLFAVIPLSGLKLSSGEHTFKVRILNIANSYKSNVEDPYNVTGRFKKGNSPFLDIELINFGFILYEEE